MTKNLGQHEDKYLHISKEAIARTIVVLCLMAVLLIGLMGIYDAGYDSGYSEGWKDSTNNLMDDIDSTFEYLGYAKIETNTGLDLICEKEEPIFVDWNIVNWNYELYMDEFGITESRLEVLE